MNKIYYLSTCDTCKRILSGFTPSLDVKYQDIKKKPVSEEELDRLKVMTGSYEALINKKARLYKERDLKNKDLSEDDYRNLLLEHYTFLKRPVIEAGDQVFIGNSKKTVEAAKNALEK